jgi:hypothetical protein
VERFQNHFADDRGDRAREKNSKIFSGAAAATIFDGPDPAKRRARRG